MEVTVARRGRTSGYRDELFSSANIEAELNKQNQSQQLSIKLQLANIFREETPPNILAQLDLPEIVNHLCLAADFLMERHDDVRVELVPRDSAGRYYLLTNSPDANHIFFSLQEYLHRRSIPFQVICHPLLAATRSAGVLKDLSIENPDQMRESFVWIQIDGMPEHLVNELRSAVITIISSAVSVYRDRAAMWQRFQDLGSIAGLDKYRDLFSWLQEDNFIPVVSRSYLYSGNASANEFKEEKERRLGLENIYEQPFFQPSGSVELTAEKVFSLLGHGKNVDLEKPDIYCPLHRFERLTYLGFREELSDGGFREHCFLGFYTQKSVEEISSAVPALRKRIEGALEQLHIPHDSHNYRKTIQIINSFPKIELFLMGSDELRRMLRSFTQMHRQAEVKVVIAPSASENGLTLLLIMPNEYYLPEHIERMEGYVRRFFNAVRVESRLIHLASDYLSMHVNLLLQEKQVVVDLVRLEQGLTRLAMPWKLKFRQLLDKNFGAQAFSLWERYIPSFHKDYRGRIHPRFAVRDVSNIEKLLASGEDLFDLWGPFHDQEDYYRLQFYSLQRSYLNSLMPFLQNLDLCILHEVDSDLTVDGTPIFIKSFAIRPNVCGVKSFKEIKHLMLDTLIAMRKGEVENDYLHQLQLLTGLSWREIDVFRCYRNYYFQLGSPFSKKRVADSLVNNHEVALLLYRYFEGRFKPCAEWDDPMVREVEVLSPIRMELATALEEVSDTNEDRILRTLFNLIDSTIRTNFFLRYHQDDYFISIKVSSLGVIDMPSPRPLYEVYVHSATMEGIHMRGGKVSRGGIRWSDRPDDFRTEVLGLVKAQMAKNAVIVPQGAKGGFITKLSSPDREQMGQYVTAAYQTLMRGLLDTADNREGAEIVRPEGVIAYDDLDPYLVVAADKGTAHLSDTANAVSNSYDFWLGDAFASGGSHGYDHKKLGITARGAWESVKRSFREMGHDIQTVPFTVIGVGDMSGDVFGNGMLLSRKIKLLAAFDHRHIFLDPNPDPEVSYQERERLFNLPRSSWDDYNKELISDGGGVYSRQLKEIPLSPQVAQLLGTRQTSIDVPGLIKLLLTAEVDLLWNGGIGTYIKASSETNEDAGDRANDAVRVDALEIKAKVVGEGGNLGLTQLGRIEYALAGGHINTDAIDNSGGVDSSDHEVNLKILLRELRHEGKVKDLEQGYQLLEEIEETVCQDVLANNYTQTLALSLDEIRCRKDVDSYLDLVDRLGRAGLLDRRGEFLPSRKDVLARHDARLVRPELSVLLAYSKMFLFSALNDTDLPQSQVVTDLLFDYFPQEVIDRYRDILPKHPLAKEITATMLTNRVIDQAGATFLLNTSRLVGCSQVEVALAYLVFDSLVGGAELRQVVYALDNKTDANKQYALLLKLEALLASYTRYALGNGMKVPQTSEDLAFMKKQFVAYCAMIPDMLDSLETGKNAKVLEQFKGHGLDDDSAYRFALMNYLGDFVSLFGMCNEACDNLAQLAKIKAIVDRKLQLDEIFEAVAKVPVRDHWDRQARESLVGSLQAVHVRIIQHVTTENADQPESYFSERRQKVRQYTELRKNLLSEKNSNFHPFTVLLRSLDGLLTI